MSLSEDMKAFARMAQILEDTFATNPAAVIDADWLSQVAECPWPDAHAWLCLRELEGDLKQIVQLMCPEGGVSVEFAQYDEQMPEGYECDCCERGWHELGVARTKTVFVKADTEAVFLADNKLPTKEKTK